MVLDGQKVWKMVKNDAPKAVFNNQTFLEMAKNFISSVYRTWRELVMVSLTVKFLSMSIQIRL